MVSILIANIDWIFAFGLQRLIENELLGSRVELCKNYQELEQKLSSKQYDMLVIDTSITTTTAGPKLVGRWLTQEPKLKVLVTSGDPIRIFAKGYFKVGVLGCIEKTKPVKEFKAAMLSVSVGNIYLDPELFLQMSRNFPDNNTEKLPPFIKLSAREYEIAMLLMEGKKPVQICSKLKLRPSTISTHKNRIFKKLGISTFIELINLAQTYSLVMPKKQWHKNSHKRKRLAI